MTATEGLGRHAREVIDECDIILEVVDARDIEGTRSRKIETLVRRRGKKLILVINKIDIARPKKIPRGMVISQQARIPTSYMRKHHIYLSVFYFHQHMLY